MDFTQTKGSVTQLALEGFYVPEPRLDDSASGETSGDSGANEVTKYDEADESRPFDSAAKELRDRGSFVTFDGVDTSKLAPMLKQYVELKRQYPNYIILFQVGDFYEVFFDDAVSVSDVLGIRLTSRDRQEENRTPMCGVPIHAIDGYLPRLLESGLSCLLFSQVEEDRKKTGIVRREISRIITPGVRFDGDGLSEKQLNYLATLVDTGQGGAIAYTDVSTGIFRILETETSEELNEALERIRPAELVLPLTLFRRPVERDTATWRELKRVCKELGISTVLRPAPEVAAGALEDRLRERCSEGLDLATSSLSREARAAIEMALNYVDEIAFGIAPSIASFKRVDPTVTVFLDAATVRNLELFETRIDRNRRHSLIAQLDRCRTSMGSRLLHTWLREPSSELAEISERADAVEFCVGSTDFVDRIRKDLVSVRDLERILSRVGCGRVSPRDLLGLRDTLGVFPSMKATLSDSDTARLRSMHDRFDTLTELSEELERSIADDAPAKLSDGGIFRIGYSSELDALRRLRTDTHQILAELESDERASTGIPNLKVRYNGVFGYFLEVSKSHLAKVPSHFERRQTLVNAERFVTARLKELEQKILSARAREQELERELFDELKGLVSDNEERLQRMCGILSELDVLLSFAVTARERNYTRPILNGAGGALEIRDGRHPVVEEVVGRHRFVPNDTLLSSERRTAILTGPNMGGKSTFLRQVGLIQILAQMGSFVPAQYVSLPLVDRIFTRIGSADDLSRGDSTFMVEMRESTAIVRKATASSLVLIDEVGRGTATSDGLAIATAIVEWLHQRIKCRTVFATHFHELTSLAQETDGMFCLSVGVVERGTEIEFTHRIEERPADRSYGIEVARLAGLPEPLLSRAEEVLAAQSESSLPGSGSAADTSRAEREAIRSVEKSSESRKLSDFISRVEPLLDRLRRCDIDRTTPIDALVLLRSLRTSADELESFSSRKGCELSSKVGK